MDISKRINTQWRKRPVKLVYAAQGLPLWLCSCLLQEIYRVDIGLLDIITFCFPDILLHRKWLIVIAHYTEVLHHVCYASFVVHVLHKPQICIISILRYGDCIEILAFLYKWKLEVYCTILCGVQHVAFHHSIFWV